VPSELTNSCSCDGVRVILVDLEGPEDVCCGMQGARPDDAQAGEMEGQQAQLADQAVLLHHTLSPLSLHDSYIAQEAGEQHENSEALHVSLLLCSHKKTLYITLTAIYFCSILWLLYAPRTNG